jgi:hypothetical protein
VAFKIEDTASLPPMPDYSSNPAARLALPSVLWPLASRIVCHCKVRKPPSREHQGSGLQLGAPPRVNQPVSNPLARWRSVRKQATFIAPKLPRVAVGP